MSLFNWRHIAFYGLVPVCVALFATISNPERIAAVSFETAFSVNLARTIPPWWVACASTWGTMGLLRPWKPSLVLLTFIGILVANVVSLPYIAWVSHIYDAVFGQGRNMVPDDWPFGFQHLPRIIMLFVQSTVIWVGANYVFDRLLGLPRYRYDGEPEPGSTRFSLVDTSGPVEAMLSTEEPNPSIPSTEELAQPPAKGAAFQKPQFMKRLSKPIKIDEVLALKAEEHYVRIYIPDAEELVLYRFSDALSELAETELGLQVHRSYWVNKSAIDLVESSGQKLSLRLKSGLSVPVSTPYYGLVRQLCALSGIPIKEQN